MKTITFVRRFVWSFALAIIYVSVSNSPAETKDAAVYGMKINAVESAQQLNSLLDSSGSRLLMFDLYAEWCLPCKILSPILDKVSTDLKSSVTLYKINIEKHPDIASSFQVSGIPLVVFVKDKKAIQAFMGLQPEGVYRRAILANSPNTSGKPKNPADGELVNGVRVITLSSGTTIGNLYVYRGEEVRLVFDKVDFPYSVHIPVLKASGSAQKGKNLTLEFKATEAGVFSMMCNGKCPVNDGQQFAKIVVMEYEPDDGKAIFKSISPKAASEMIAKEKPFLLDVRTPNEYYDAHISGATLIPVQQLAERITELDAVKDKSILVYCRSGNRSIPASQILSRNGFKKIYNLQNGINGWMKENLPVERQQ
jgi:thioredoxin